MKQLIPGIILLFSGILFGQHYIPVDKGSVIKFSIKNFGVSVAGTFTGLKGSIQFDPANLSAASITASVDAATVNTGNSMRDRHLKKDDYFEVAKYPLIQIQSSSIRQGKSSLLFEGTIVMKGVSKKISFPFSATARAGGYLLEGNFNINRRDFDIGPGSLVLSDKLLVTVSVLAK